MTGTTGSKVSDVLLSWEFGEQTLQQGTVFCSRSVGSKEIPVDVIRLSETPRFRVYVCAEGENLTSADLVGEWTSLDETFELEGLVQNRLDIHGADTTLILALANWSIEDIDLEDPCRGLVSVVDHGEGFSSLEFSGTDDRTVFPGTMGLFTLDPEGEEEGFMSLDLQDGGEIIIAWGETDDDGGDADGDSTASSGSGSSSGGCSGAGGLPWILLFGLPVLGLSRRNGSGNGDSRRA